MNLQYALKYLLAVISMVVLAGCANQIGMSSQKTSGFANRLDTVLIVTRAPDNALDINKLIDMNSNYYARIIPNVVQLFEKDKIKADSLKLNTLALNSQETIADKAKEIGAGYVLNIDLTRRTVKTIPVAGQPLTQQEYDIALRLHDVHTNQTLWVGKVHIFQDYNALVMDKNMQEIANRIVAVMKIDNLL